MDTRCGDSSACARSGPPIRDPCIRHVSDILLSAMCPQKHFADPTRADTFAWLCENQSADLRLTETVRGGKNETRPSPVPSDRRLASFLPSAPRSLCAGGSLRA